MRADRDIKGGLAIRARFALEFVVISFAVFLILGVIAYFFFDDPSDFVGTAAGFVGWSFVMGAALGGLISLGNLFFGNPDNRASEHLLNPAAFGGLAAGGLIGLWPFLAFSGSPSGAMTLGSWAIVGLVFASPLSLVFGAIIAFKSEYPLLGDLVMAGTIGVLAMITSFAS
jgi:hypothetical protein